MHTPPPDEKLLPAAFLFRFAVPCRYRDPLWTARGAQLDEAHRLPSLGLLDDEPAWSEFRAAWSEAGLAISVRVEGKRQPPWCRANRIEDSDGVAVWIDTRDTHNVHRSGRFCHEFHFLPSGGGRKSDEPVAAQLAIDRAREQPRPVGPELLAIRSEKRIDGYLLEALVPATALTGFEPAEHPRLGFQFAVRDREKGEQTFTVAGDFPYRSDPSLWGTLELVGKSQ